MNPSFQYTPHSCSSIQFQIRNNAEQQQWPLHSDVKRTFDIDYSNELLIIVPDLVNESDSFEPLVEGLLIHDWNNSLNGIV